MCGLPTLKSWLIITTRYEDELVRGTKRVGHGCDNRDLLISVMLHSAIPVFWRRLSFSARKFHRQSSPPTQSLVPIVIEQTVCHAFFQCSRLDIDV
jgi:hypothetical protein